jgi:hypothetical protein
MSVATAPACVRKGTPYLSLHLMGWPAVYNVCPRRCLLGVACPRHCTVGQKLVFIGPDVIQRATVDRIRTAVDTLDEKPR